jgi:D-alanyl-D-alanine carboxypeptidase/D-alanyl-D-alanine-endopeptidase (penicillin-binding protein 4)
MFIMRRFGWLLPAALLAGAAGGCSSVPDTLSAQARATQAGLRSQPPEAVLAGRIDALLADSLFPPANAGVKAVSLRNGSVLYERNPGLLFTPASNQKLFTTAAALGVLGPFFRVATTAAIDSAGRRIYIKGGGDPLLTTGDLDSLATRVRALLPDGGSWSLVGDASRFDSVYWGPGWMWDDAADPSGMGVTALSVNGNSVEVHVRAGQVPGEPPSVTVVPPTGFMRVENRGIVADSIRRELSVSRPLQHPSNVILVAGELLPGQLVSTTLTVFEPDRYALTLFAEALARAGIHCADARLDTMPRALAPAAVVSRRLDSIVTFMNRVSDNLSAECLFKLLGAAATGEPGTWQAGAHAVKLFLASSGIDTARIAVVDGSGLSRYNLTNAETIVRLLEAMARSPEVFRPFSASLPAAGEEGTLSRRMRRTVAEHLLRAKTGTMTGVSSLSGYTTGVDGEPIAFSIIMENFPGSERSYRLIQDNIGVLLSTWNR